MSIDQALREAWRTGDDLDPLASIVIEHRNFSAPVAIGAGEQDALARLPKWRRALVVALDRLRRRLITSPAV